MLDLLNAIGVVTISIWTILLIARNVDGLDRKQNKKEVIEVKITIPPSLLHLGELSNACKDLVTDLKADKDTKKLGENLEGKIETAIELAQRESVQKFATALENVLTNHPIGNVAIVLTALLLIDTGLETKAATKTTK